MDIGTLGEQTPNPLIDAVNMAGINAPSFSVGDNFDAVVANITHDSNSGLYQSDPSGGADPNGWIGFNFGSVFLVERLALWNHNESDSQGINNFMVFSGDAGFTNLVSLGPTFIADQSTAGEAQGFDITDALTQFIYIVTTGGTGVANHGHPNQVGFAEIAFEGRTPPPIPEPSTFILSLAGLGLLALGKRWSNGRR